MSNIFYIFAEMRMAAGEAMAQTAYSKGRTIVVVVLIVGEGGAFIKMVKIPGRSCSLQPGLLQ